jgi:mevalonate kinase
MSKTYTLLLNSANSVNRSGTAVTDYTYYVNWASFLPQNVERFDVSYSFKSTLTSTLQSSVVLLSANIGNQTTYDQTYSQTPILCALTPYSNPGSTINFFYESKVTDECGFMISYPQNNNLSIRILNAIPDANGLYSSAASFTGMSYILQLSFTEIEKDEKLNLLSNGI